ncbi:hypothetical protein [Flavihumibacter profundi]|jgi:hypothetical protein|uniref:hypothetical protein n=1 Tax=Flavihumibacter profundi TaxID=2716883 RepID=UPI001CC58B87|nr:hypothetical protein [Flavihumibacter profundi]MBZ5855480.1 hypothetical protein [Flavihumibacter profundi]
MIKILTTATLFIILSTCISFGKTSSAPNKDNNNNNTSQDTLTNGWSETTVVGLVKSQIIKIHFVDANHG